MLLTDQAAGEFAVNNYVGSFNNYWGWAGAITADDFINAMLKDGQTKLQFLTEFGKAINENIGDYPDRIRSVMNSLARNSLGRLPKSWLNDRNAIFDTIAQEKMFMKAKEAVKEAAEKIPSLIPWWVYAAGILLILFLIAYAVNYVLSFVKNLKAVAS